MLTTTNRRALLRTLALLACLAPAAAVAAADTVTGEVIDVSCYLGHG